jgi:LuxR family maltose regulon positive regulatory protein
MRGGDEAAGLDALAESVSEAEPGGGLRFFLDLGDPMADLLRRLARERGDSAFLKSLRLAFGERAAPVSGRRPPIPAAPSDSGAVLLDALTTREGEILNLLAGRLRDKEIAEALFISTETVKSHLKHVYQKLGVGSRREAVAKARDLGLLLRD